MIQVNGHIISDIVVSTILGHSGSGMFPLTLLPAYRETVDLIKQKEIAVLTKSSTYFPRVGNYILHKPWTWKYIQNLGEDGMLNAYGLTNRGVAYNARQIKKAINKGFNVIPNIAFEFSNDTSKEEAYDRIEKAVLCYQQEMGIFFWALEINSSCANTKADISKNTGATIYCVKKLKKKFPWLTIIVKISWVHPPVFATQLEDAGADIIHSINTIPFNLVFPGKKSPLHFVGGGTVSGGPAREMSLRKNEEFRSATNLPMIMGCGVTSWETAQEFFHIDADSVSLCSVVKRDPMEAQRIITI